MRGIPTPAAGGTATISRGPHGAAAAQPVAAQAAPMLQVVCPAGVAAGQAVQVQGPAGLMMVTVPAGVAPGQAFAVAMPAAPVVTATAVAVELNQV